MVIVIDASASRGVTVSGLKVAVAPEGSPEADMVTALLHTVPAGVTVILMFTEWPEVTPNGPGGATIV
jgi:hypothetical protein